MPAAPLWNRDKILAALQAGKTMVTRDHEGKYRDLRLSRAVLLLREGKLYPVVVGPYEIVVYLP